MPGKCENISKTNSLPFPELGEEVVISGIAGRFPESDNLTHLKNNLFNKQDLITEDDRRWKRGNPNIPQRTGKINNLEKFDADFFGMESNAVDMMDPMSRILLEHSYEAVVDAGVNPHQLRGTNTGVFIGACYVESEKIGMYEGEFDVELENCDNWDERLAVFTETLLKNGIVHFTADEHYAACSSIYSRIKATYNYDCSAIATSANTNYLNQTRY